MIRSITIRYGKPIRAYTVKVAELPDLDLPDLDWWWTKDEDVVNVSFRKFEDAFNFAAEFE